MSDEQIMKLIDGAFYDSTAPHIGLSGGEAFLYFYRLCKFIKYASDKGALTSVNTNAFWGVTLDKAVEKLRILKEIGLTRLVVSMDDFHEEFIKPERVINVIRACKQVHQEVELQYVATKSTQRLGDFLKEHGDDLLNINCREIPCHPVGRASTMVKEEDLFLEQGIPEGLCPSAILSISAFGKVIPCCNTAGHLPTLQIGTIDDPLPELHQKFINSSLLRVLVGKGPKVLMDAAIKAGYEPRPNGYVDQCHLCYDLFKNEKTASAIKRTAEEMVQEETYNLLLENFQRNLESAES